MTALIRESLASTSVRWTVRSWGLLGGGGVDEPQAAGRLGRAGPPLVPPPLPLPLAPPLPLPNPARRLGIFGAAIGLWDACGDVW